MNQTAFFPFFSLIVFFCPTEMLTFFVLSFGAFFFAAAGALTAAALYLRRREKELDEYERLLYSDDGDDYDDDDEYLPIDNEPTEAAEEKAADDAE